MISVLGFQLEKAVEDLEKAGYRVVAAETRSRKGVNGNQARVVRQRIEGDRAELVWAIFKTDCEYGG